MNQTVAIGAALQYTQDQLGGPCVETNNGIVIGNAVTDLVQGNGDRVALIIVNNGAQDLFIALDATVSANIGIKVSANGGNVAMNVRDDFTLPSRNWKAISPGGNTNVYVIELVRFSLNSQQVQR